MNRPFDAYRQVLRKAPTSRLALPCACALLALATDVASAAGIGLAWNNCLGGGGVTNRTFACNTNAGSRSLYISFVPPADVSRVASIEAVIDIEAGASALPDWWRFDAGGCREGALTASASFSGVSGCANAWTGGEVAACVYTAPYGGANRARLLAVCASSDPAGVAVTPGSEYYGCKLAISSARTVGAGACAGCSEVACLTLRSVKLIEGVTGREVMLFGSLPQPAVTWQAGLPVCPLSWPTVSINDVSAAEGNTGTTPFNFTVSLSEASPVSVSVAYATADSTAAAGSDYVAASGMLTFTTGQVSKSLPISVTGEAAFEPDENFIVNLTPTSNAGPGDLRGIGTIVNDDSPPTISVSDVTAPEGAEDSTSFTFTVSLSAASWQPVTVAFATADGTAAAPVDYAPVAGTLTFAPGESSKPVVVTVYGDHDWESDETFTVRLSAPTNATIADSAGTGTIQNDDSGGGNCETSVVDFGDAPEETLAYPGVMGHFPTCLYPGSPGDRTTDCGTALGSAPGATGYVKHTQGPGGYWLGCQPGFPLPWGIDSETDGKVNADGGAVSACDPSVSVDCVETIPGYPIAYGQDECYGDLDAAFSASDLSAIFGNSCGATSIPLRTFNCGPPRQVHLNLLVDWNGDGDWNDAGGCVSDVGCSPEWCVKNAVITLPSGCATVNTPIFKLGWNNCSGPRGWMRVTICNNPVSPSFPWNGGLLNGGETEDYLVGGPACTLGSPPTQQDLGDAPEGIPAYSSGVVGRFPTCLVGTVLTGTQELECAAPGTAPGPSGAVVHSGSGPSLGCSGLNSLLSIDTEGMAAVTSALVGGEAIACESEVSSDCSQTIFGRTFGQDECLGDVDAGAATIQLVAGTQASVTLSMARFGTAKTAYLNILADWNADGDWNDALLSGPSLCAPEWAVKNHAFVLESGCSQVASPTFRVGPHAGESWMRITLADEPAPNDFPWKGAFFSSGETEDHPVVILPDPTAVEPGSSGPATWFRPAYPSPAHDVTWLRFRLAREAEVTLTIYSTDGRRIRTLVRGIQAQGEHEVRWDGSDDEGRAAPKGLYVTRFSALGQTVSHKLIWLGRR